MISLANISCVEALPVGASMDSLRRPPNILSTRGSVHPTSGQNGYSWTAWTRINPDCPRMPTTEADVTEILDVVVDGGSSYPVLVNKHNKRHPHNKIPGIVFDQSLYLVLPKGIRHAVWVKVRLWAYDAATQNSIKNAIGIDMGDGFAYKKTEGTSSSVLTLVE